MEQVLIALFALAIFAAAVHILRDKRKGQGGSYSKDHGDQREK